MDLHVTWGGQCPAELLTQVGEWLERQGDIPGALAYYDAAISVDDDWSLAAYRAGSLLARLNRPQEAAPYARKAVAAASDHAPSWYLASKVSLSCGDAALAFEQAQRALELDENHVGAALVSLRALMLKADWHQVLDFGTTWTTLACSTEARLIRALAFCRVGDYGQALMIWSETTPRERRRFSDVAKEVEASLEAATVGSEGRR